MNCFALQTISGRRLLLDYDAETRVVRPLTFASREEAETFVQGGQERGLVSPTGTRLHAEWLDIVELTEPEVAGLCFTIEGESLFPTLQLSPQ